MSIIPKHYLNAVTPIGVRNNQGTIWIGTGFYVVRRVDENGMARPFLVTNKHVVTGRKNIIVRMMKKNDATLNDVDAPLDNQDGPIYKLHKESAVDIAVIPLNATFIKEQGYDFPAFDIDGEAMSSPDLRESGVDEGSLIHMLGFPMGLVNQQSMLPICRLGCIARMSEVQIKEQKNLLVDIQNFPGNSGSPIILRPDGVHIKGTKNLSRSVLVGIIHSYIPYEETLINSQTKKIVEVKSENSGIAYAHPVEFIRDIIDEIQPKMDVGGIPQG